MFKTYLILGGFAASLLLLGGVYVKGYFDGKNDAKAAMVEKSIDDKEKINVIKNNRPDDDALFDSLRSATL